jgi:hypothetical protein
MLSAIVTRISTGLLRQGVSQQLALQRIASNNSGPDDIEILARVFIVPGSAARGKRLQTHRRSRSVARNTPRMTYTFGGEDRLDMRFEIFKIQRRRRGRLLYEQRSDDRQQG